MDVSVVIMAAGKGSRMKSDLPKVLHKITGKSMLAHILDSALMVSDDIHVVLHHQAIRVQEEIEQDYSGICFHLQDAQRYPGTGGALMQGGDIREAKAPISLKYERVLILNGDMPLVQKDDLEAIIKGDAPMVVSALRLEDPSGYGRVVVENQCVQGIVEEKDCNQEYKKIKLVNAGIYLCHQDVLKQFLPTLENQNAQQEYYLTDLVAKCVQAGIKVGVIEGKAESFMGVNSKLDLSLAEMIMLKRLRDRAMENGVVMSMPESIYIDCQVEFVGECVLEQGVKITGKSVIKNAHIKAHSVVESSLIENSDVGPMAHVRPKCEIVDSHIGNFVEIKAAKLVGVKAGHLSYLGDCEIGRGSNIGAGVITCNYDGKKKHQTLIGENVFVGSDCQLIAPLKIESNVLIAAGSSVKQDARSGDLVIARSDQRNIANGYFKFFKKEG